MNGVSQIRNAKLFEVTFAMRTVASSIPLSVNEPITTGFLYVR